MKGLYVGSKDSSLKVLKTLLSLAPDSISGIVTVEDTDDARSALPQFRQLAGELGIPIYVGKNKMLRQATADLQPDFVFVYGWYWILANDLLAQFPQGVIGIHNSLLPKFRGGSPLVWSIIEGGPVGTSLFYLTEGTDTGDILAQREIPLGSHEHMGEILPRIEALHLDMVNAVYRDFLAGRPPRTVQDHTHATHFPQRKSHDGKIDWTQPPEKIFNFIRALSRPYPGAFDVLENGDKKIYWKVALGTDGQIEVLESELRAQIPHV